MFWSLSGGFGGLGGRGGVILRIVVSPFYGCSRDNDCKPPLFPIKLIVAAPAITCRFPNAASRGGLPCARFCAKMGA